MAPTGCYARLEKFSERRPCLLNGLLRQLVPNALQDGFQLCNSCWFGRVLLVLLQHHAPHAEIKRIQVWGVWRQFILPNEAAEFLGQPLLRLMSCVGRSTILLEDEILS